MTLFFCKECTAKYLFVKHENNFQTNIINQYPELKGVCVAHAIVKIGENKNFSDVIINTGKMENYICQSTWGLENASFSWKCCSQMLRRLKLVTITITPEILGWFGPQYLEFMSRNLYSNTGIKKLFSWLITTRLSQNV